MSTQKPKILCVDDETRILESFRRGLRHDFDLVTAESGMKGLIAIEELGPFEVIVTDMRMPAMDGVEFLTKAAKIAPQSVRMMLTGYADQQTAIQAINEGKIFRFLSKPTPVPMLIQAIYDAVEQFRLVTAEKELLEKTLTGAIKVLTDVLSITNSAAYARATQISNLALEIAFGLDVQETWKLQMASQLFLIGSVTVPEEVIEGYYTGHSLEDSVQGMIDEIPQVTRRLLEHIPRLDPVLSIIEYVAFEAPRDYDRKQPERFLANIIRTVNDFYMLVGHGTTYNEAIARLKNKPQTYHLEVVETLGKVLLGNASAKTQILTIDQLKAGMILADEIRNVNGMLLAPAGFVVNDPMRQRLRNFKLQGIVLDEVVVKVDA